MNNNFHVGQQVICIDDRAGFYMGGCGLVIGKTYTIKSLHPYDDGDLGLNVGTKVNGISEDAWLSTRFVPAQDAIEQVAVEQHETATA